MGTKLIPGAFDCHKAALPDEEMFILLARDKSAPAMLRIWADTRRRAVLGRIVANDGRVSEQDEEDLRKCTEADVCADNMTIWRARNDGRWREGADRRQRLGDVTPQEMDDVRAAVINAVGAMLQITSQLRTGNVSIAHHTERPWACADFNGRVHTLRIVSIDRFTNRDATLDLEQLKIQGLIVADFVIEWLDESNIALRLYTVEDS